MVAGVLRRRSAARAPCPGVESSNPVCECIFQFEFRYLPGANPDALEREIRDYAERVILLATT